jgi:hypothetical protein
MTDDFTTNITTVFAGQQPRFRIFPTNVIPVADLLPLAINRRVDVTAEDANGNASARITVPLLQLEMHLDPASTKPLEDWPAANGRPRSPKNLLNTNDQVYLTFRAEPGRGDNFFAVRVKSETDPSGLTIKLQETQAGVYRNVSSQDVLRFVPFDPEANQVAGVEIKDEELVRFEVFQPGGSNVFECDVIVDIGELALATLVHSDRPPEAKPRFDFIDRFFLAPDGFHFASAGVQIEIQDNIGQLNGPGPDNFMGLFIINFADPLLPHVGESDVLYTHSHGSRTGKLMDHKRPDGSFGAGFDIVIPEVHILGSGKWNRDADFLILDACSTLNAGLNDDLTPTGRPAGLTNWLNTLRSSSRPLHGILGFEFPKTAYLRPAYRDFMTEMQNGTSIPTAWGDAMTDAGMPWAALWFLDNLDDTIRIMTQDPNPADIVRYIEFTGVFSTECEDQAGDPRPFTGEVVPFGNRLSLARSVVSSGTSNTLLPRARSLRPFALTLGELQAAGSLETRPLRQHFTPHPTNATLTLRATNETTAGAAAMDYLNRLLIAPPGSFRPLGVGEIRSRLLTNNAPTPPPTHETYVALFRQELAGVPVDGRSIRVELSGSSVQRVLTRGLMTPSDEPGQRPELLPILPAWDALNRHLPRLEAAVPAAEHWIITQVELIWVRDPDSTPAPDAPLTFIPAWRFDLRKAFNNEFAGTLLLHAVDASPIATKP